jgi:hypothetical protein
MVRDLKRAGDAEAHLSAALRGFVLVPEGGRIVDREIAPASSAQVSGGSPFDRVSPFEKRHVQRHLV